MHDLQKVAGECIDEMKRVGIPIRDEEIVGIEAKEIRECFGLCTRNECWQNFKMTARTYKITVHEDLIRDECPEKELKEVVVHELIHTCPRCGIHGKTWRKYAQIMIDAYGYSLLEGKDNNSIFHKDKPILHKYVCPKCGVRYDSRSEGGDHQCPFCKAWYEEIT